MEYNSFVRGLRKESYKKYACPPDTQYAKEFEDKMHVLVVNFDIDDTKLEPQQQHSFTSTPLASGSGWKGKTRRKGKSAPRFDDTEQMEVPRKKKAIENVQQMNDEHELPSSVDSSEGISMHFDSSSSNDDFPDVDRHTREAKVQKHPNNSFPFEAIQGEDSLLEPSADYTSNEGIMFATKLLHNPVKRTYDEANS